MRWVLTLAALSLGVWYLTNRQRRDQLGQAVQDGTPPETQARVKDAVTTASDAAQSAAATVTEKAQGLAQQASKAVGDTAANVGQTSASVADRAGQTVESATQEAQEAAGVVEDVTQKVTGAIAEGAPQTGATAPAATGPGDTQQAATAANLGAQAQDTAPRTATHSAVETDMSMPPPSIRETVQAEMADVGEHVDRLRAQSEEPPDPAEKSAGEFFGAGAIAATDLHLTQVPATRQEAETVEGGVEPLLGAATTAAAGAADAPAPDPVRATGSQKPSVPVGIGVTGDLGAGAIPSGPANTVADDISPIGTPDQTGGATSTSDKAGMDMPTTIAAGAGAPEATSAGVPAPGPKSAAPRSAQGTTGRTLTTDDSIVPEGERPREIAGEGTTTAAGGNVDILSPVADGQTATGATEPLPAGLAPGMPGTGGPASSMIAPSTPGVGTPKIGMQTTPVVDRAAEVTARTSGKYVGNRKKRVFHPATSSDLPSENNRVYFETIEEATAAGFTPAPNEDRGGA